LHGPTFKNFSIIAGKNTDPDMFLLKQGKAEYAKLQSLFIHLRLLRETLF
jgi:hypothetical protein